MRILLAADQYPEYHNGAGAFTERLAAGLVSRGCQVTTAYPSSNGAGSADRRAGHEDQRVESHRLPRGRGLRVSTPAAAERLAEMLLGAEPAPDVVHVQSHLPVGRSFVAVARRLGIPVVATNHFMPENLLPHLPLPDPVRRRVGGWAWRDLAAVFAQASSVTTPTRRAADLLTARTGLTDIEVISNGVDLTRFSPHRRQSVTTSVPFVLFVGRLEHEKRVETLLHAFAALPGERSARLVYIGTGSRLDPLRRQAHAAGISDRVEFWGNVSEAQLRRAYADCAVFAAPGVAELQSLVTLEAVASGAPVIAADAVALPHLVHHGRNGFCYAPDRSEQLTRHLATLLGNPQLRRRMGEQSRLIAQHHTIEATIDAYLDCYLSVIDPVRTADDSADAAVAA